MKESDIVQELVENIELGEGELFHDQYHEGYYAPNGDGSKIVKMSSREFKELLAMEAWDNFHHTLSSQGTNKLTQTLTGIAKYKGALRVLSVRHVSDEHGLWYDLGNGQAVLVTTKGWEVVTPPILFRRLPHQKPQALPERGGDLKALANYINVTSENERLLFTIFVAAAFIPGFPHPLLILHGSQGAGKSTPMRMMKELIDPSILQGLSTPNKLEAFAQIANHHAFMFFDNLSKLPEWFSDALARASTGDGFSKRTLYTDDDDTFYILQKVIALNGINQVITKPDLLDRSVLLKLQRITTDKRKPDNEFWGQFEADRPLILGAIFDTLSKAMKLQPSLKLVDLPRMADFAIWGYAIADVAGYNGDKFIEAYRTNIKLQNEEAIEQSPVAQAIIAFVEDKDIWEDSPAALLKALNWHPVAQQFSSALGWPKDPAWLTKKINEVQPNLSDKGILVEQQRTHNGRLTRITKSTVSTDTTVDTNSA